MDGVSGEIVWATGGGEIRARYVSARGGSAPSRAMAANDETTADDAFRATSQGTALVWDGDYDNARQLLQAKARLLVR